MGEQRTFASLAWSTKGKVTRRERFLAEMNAVIPWARLVALIEPHYPKGGSGGQPKGLEKMLRIYFLQQWFDLSDPAAEDAIYDIEPMRRFVGVELGEDDVPDESTILRFRHLLEEYALTKAIFAEVGSLLEEKRLILKSGTIVDATIISAPSSTKNQEGKRDPEMEQTKKGNRVGAGRRRAIGGTPLLLRCLRSGLDRTLEVVLGDPRDGHVTGARRSEHRGLGREEVGGHVPRHRMELPLPTVIVGVSRSHRDDTLLARGGPRRKCVEVVPPCVRRGRRRHYGSHHGALVEAAAVGEDESRNGRERGRIVGRAARGLDHAVRAASGEHREQERGRGEVAPEAGVHVASVVSRGVSWIVRGHVRY